VTDIHQRLASESCRLSACESIESSMGYKRKILGAIDDPSAKKILTMRWWELAEITPDQAERLIHELGLEAA
jgi:hypothetical protein